jgi:very-short-patch-repair endonuclease/peroxiredoxin
MGAGQEGQGARNLRRLTTVSEGQGNRMSMGKREPRGLSGTTRREVCRDLRERQTPPEEFFWELVRDRRFAGLKFRRQHPLGDFIVDFYCPTLHLAVELDGGVHNDQASQDRDRDEMLAELGVRVLRIRNADFLADPEAALALIRAGDSPDSSPRIAPKSVSPSSPKRVVSPSSPKRVVSPSPAKLEKGPGDEATAPDLTLASTAGPQRLRPSPGRRLLVIFYQEDNTPACSTQLASFRDDFEVLRELDADVVAISSDDLASHEQFAHRLGNLPFPLLSDSDGSAAKQFGVWSAENQRADRSVFVVDDEGKIRYASRHYSLGNLAEYTAVFEALGLHL